MRLGLHAKWVRNPGIEQRNVRLVRLAFTDGDLQAIRHIPAADRDRLRLRADRERPPEVGEPTCRQRQPVDVGVAAAEADARVGRLREGEDAGDVAAVLELNAGEADRIGLKPGDVVVYPGLADGAGHEGK